jgi:hypothetical protein
LDPGDARSEFFGPELRIIGIVVRGLQTEEQLSGQLGAVRRRKLEGSLKKCCVEWHVENDCIFRRSMSSTIRGIIEVMPVLTWYGR